MDYNTIKQIAADHGLRISDLLALAPANDPFYTGRPAEIAAAHWFANHWRSFGYASGVHLRRVHYQIVSQTPPVQLPNGNGVYENTQNCWDFLNQAAKWARYLDLVPAELFVDRRNPEAIINRRYYDPTDDYYNPTPRLSISSPDEYEWDQYNPPAIPELPTLPTDLPNPPAFSIQGYDYIQQPYLVEIWAEKTTMNDILIPLAEKYSANIVTGAGELSITAVIAFLKRVEQHATPARILYVSDFDPAGLGMPISVARKIEFYQRKGEYIDLDIALNPIVLTPDQIATYHLPRVPVKDSDKRKASFEAAYGTGQVELDALEALHPGELANIVEQAILTYYDPTLRSRARSMYRNLVWHMDDVRQAILDEPDDIEPQITFLAEEYDELWSDYLETRQQFADLVAPFQEKLDAYQQRLARIHRYTQEHHATIAQLLQDAAAQTNLDEFALPDADLPDEPDQLYASDRTYIEQLTYYKDHRSNSTQLEMKL